MKLYLSLGTNLGGREANIARALSLLDEALGKPEAISQIIETEAVGFDGPAFLNCVVRYDSRRRPRTILRLCKEIERKMGRVEIPEVGPDGRRIYHDRIIDIDILLYGKIRMETPDLVLPHPQVESRPFVKPLLEEVFV